MISFIDILSRSTLFRVKLLNSKNKKTLKAIFEEPTRSDIRWNDIESLIQELGGVIKQGNGSRVRFQIGELTATVHRPHPRAEIGKPLVKDLCRLLNEGGFKPEE